MRLSHMLAAAAVLALVAAMFVAYAPARAATGDVSHTSGWCLAAGSGADAGHYISNTETAPTIPQTSFAQDTTAGANQVTVELEDDGTSATARDTDELADHVVLTCSAANVGKAVTITPNNTPVPGITYHDPELVVSLASTATVPSTVALRAYVKYQRAGVAYTFNTNAALAANIAPASGVTLPAVPFTITGAASLDAATAESLAVLGDVTVLASASGEYTITLGAVSDETPAKSHYGRLTFSVSEPTVTPASDKVATATLELGDSEYDNPLTSKSEAVAEDGKESATGGDVWLKLSVLNAAGKASANVDIKSVTIVAPGGTIDLVNALKTGRPNIATTGGDNTIIDLQERIGSTSGAPGTAEATAFNHSNATAADDTDATSTMFVLVTATASTPGPVPVYALINGSLRSNTVDLVFTGPTVALAIEGSGKTLKSTSGELAFTVKGMDINGNDGTTVLSSSLILTIKNADDEAVTNPAIADKEQGTGAKAANVTFKVTTGTTAADSGTYTIEAQLAGNDKSKTSATFNVAGPAANIALSADPESADATGLVTLTAVVTDEAGVNVPDGTAVEFAAVGGGASLITPASRSTVNGVAKATLGVTSYGTTIVYATSGDAAANLSFVSTAGADAMEDREPSLGDLRNKLGLTSYSGPDTTASALMALLTGRASAIWLSSGGGWILYANVDGAMVPGSADFTVTSGDVLYISN